MYDGVCTYNKSETNNQQLQVHLHTNKKAKNNNSAMRVVEHSIKRGDLVNHFET